MRNTFRLTNSKSLIGAAVIALAAILYIVIKRADAHKTRGVDTPVDATQIEDDSSNVESGEGGQDFPPDGASEEWMTPTPSSPDSANLQKDTAPANIQKIGNQKNKFPNEPSAKVQKENGPVELIEDDELGEWVEPSETPPPQGPPTPAK